MTLQTFSEWRDRPLDEMLYQCRELLEDVDYPTVRRWREAGGKVVEPKMPIPGIGWFAACAEPGGLLFGVLEADPEAK